MLPENSFPTTRQLIQPSHVTEHKMRTFVSRNILYLFWYTVSECVLNLLWLVELHLFIMHAHIWLRCCNSPTDFYKGSHLFLIAKSTFPYNDQVQCVALSYSTVNPWHKFILDFFGCLSGFTKEVDLLSDRSRPDGTFCIALDLQTQGLILKLCFKDLTDVMVDGSFTSLLALLSSNSG